MHYTSIEKDNRPEVVMTLSPSLLAADFVNLSSQLDILVESGVNTLHFNVMDGDFVPALSFGAGILADILANK